MPVKYSENKIIIILLFTAILVISGCSKQETAGRGGAFQMPPMPAEIAEAKLESVSDNFEAIGTIQANESITVVSEIDGAIVSLPFEEGSFVRKGSLIAKLDDSQIIAEVSRAEALEAQSHTSYDRIKKVVDQKAGSLQDLDDAAAALKVADANLALAKARFAKTRIVAPFDGVIGARRVSVGTFLRTGSEITELANINDMRVSFSAPERYLSQLKKGAEVLVSSSAKSENTIKGRILVIEPILDPTTRNANVIARIPNTDKKFLPGMSANVSAVLSVRNNAITIPSESVFANGDQSFVFVVDTGGTVMRRPIKLGLQLPEVVEVTEGLAAGEKVVQAGHQKLFDGAKVMPVAASGPAGQNKEM